MRRVLAGALVALALGAGQATSQSADALAGARAHYVAGRYDDAIAAFAALAQRHSQSALAARGLVRALAEIGRYDDASRAAERYAAANPASPALAATLADVLVERGRLKDAEAAYRRALDGGASDSLRARLGLAMLARRRGRLDEASRAFNRFIDVYNRSPSLSAEELSTVATAVRFLGTEEPQLYKDALRAYDEALAKDPDLHEAQVLLGEMLLEKYNGSEARAAFEAVLAKNPRHPRALLGLARVMKFAGEPGVLEQVSRSLEVNPHLVSARVFLAELHLEAERYSEAEEEVDRALAVDPASLEALAVLGAVRLLQGDDAGYGAARRRALAINPRYADFYNTVAEASGRNRLYQRAARMAAEAVALDPRSWRGHALLGINQLRVGAMAEGRASLERAFAGDPYDLWTKNTLDLLDALDGYREEPSQRFRFVVDPEESGIMSLYLAPIAEDAYTRLAARYGYAPPTPIRVEVYQRHADFSVRTVGLVGLGALGVCFGPVIAMNSPSAQDPGSFHWGSTLWHEVAHAFHLGMTGNRVPRWFTEGLAVLEERRARPGWGDGLRIEFVNAFHQGRLRNLAELNEGFVRPAYPEQIAWSYYQASLVLEYIESRYGESAITKMLTAYRDGGSTGDVFRSVLGTDVAAVDREVNRELRQRYGPLLRSFEKRGEGSDDRRPSTTAQVEQAARRDPDDVMAQLAAGGALVEAERYREAIPFLDRAKALFPGYAGPGNAYRPLAVAHRALGAVDRAARELRALVERNAGDYRAAVELAGALEELGDRRGALEALERAFYVYPFDAALHRRAASHAAAIGQWAAAIRERRAVLALDPVDRAEALYELAVAYHRAGDRENARRTVLQALERAPGYAAAQDLLLEIHRRP